MTDLISLVPRLSGHQEGRRCSGHLDLGVASAQGDGQGFNVKISLNQPDGAETSTGVQNFPTETHSWARPIQWETSEQIFAGRRRSRVTPPNTHSLSRLWP